MRGKNENLSMETIKKMRELGFERIRNIVLYGDSYLNIFHNSDIGHTVTLVKSPKEVAGVWLATAFNNVLDKRFDLNNISGLNIDNFGRAHLQSEEEIVSLAEELEYMVRKNDYER